MQGKIKCCYKCSRRTSDCHTWCGDYVKEAAENSKLNEEALKNQPINDYVADRVNYNSHKAALKYDKTGRKMY